MGRSKLSSRRGLPQAAPHGFTFIETMIALSISIVVLLANIYLFNTAHKDLALARSVTAATNLATDKIAEIKARVINAPLCFDAGTVVPNPGLGNYVFTGNGSPCTKDGTTGDINPDYPGLVNEDFCSPPSSRNRNYPLKAGAGPSVVPLCTAPGVRNPLFVAGARKAVPITETETITSDGIPFNRAWVLSAVDLEHDGVADLTDDVVKITVEISWTLANKGHRVAMTTFATGKVP